MQWLQINFANEKLAEINVLYKQVSNSQLKRLHSFIYRNLGKYRMQFISFIPNGNYMTGKSLSCFWSDWASFSMLPFPSIVKFWYSLSSLSLQTLNSEPFAMSALIILLNLIPDPFLNRGCSRSFCLLFMLLFKSSKYCFEKCRLRLRTISKETFKNLGVGILTFQFSQVS